MIKYALPAVCLMLASCTIYTYPDNTNPYYNVQPPQANNYYSYQNLQTPMTQTSLRHPFVPTTPAPKPLTPAPRTLVPTAPVTTTPIYHGPVISKKLPSKPTIHALQKSEEEMPTK